MSAWGDLESSCHRYLPGGLTIIGQPPYIKYKERGLIFSKLIEKGCVKIKIFARKQGGEGGLSRNRGFTYFIEDFLEIPHDPA